jgi:WD40 repeat protein
MFENHWRAGARPDLLDAVGCCPPADRAAALRELVHAELEFRLKAGEPAGAAEYLARFPELAADPAAADELRAAEAEFRARRGDAAGTPAVAMNLEATFDTAADSQTGNTAVQAARPLPPGLPAAVGGYRVVRELGRGGMGVVLECADDRLGRPVAVKLIAAEFAASGHARERFLREGRSLARLDHSNVVPVIHTGEDSGRLYLVMPLLQGETLEARLQREGKLPPGELVRIGREVALGLAAAHAVGIVHRDVKPANIWLEAGTGRARLLDFGLAKPLADGPDDLTETGAVMGTVHYMSPEQAEGRPVDARTDLFSLGAVLYHAATGSRPFTGESKLAVMIAVKSDTPAAPESLNPALPPHVAALIRGLLAKAPAGRPASAEAVGAALESPAALAAPARRRPRRALAVAVALLAAAVAALVAADVIVVRDKNGKEVARVVLPAVPKGGTIDHIDDSGNSTPIRPQKLEPPLVIPPGSGRYPLALAEVPSGANGPEGAVVIPTVCQGPVRAVAFRHDGRELAALGSDNVIRIYETGKLALLRAFVCPAEKGHAPAPVTDLAWSPDGKWIVTGDVTELVQLRDAKTGNVRWEAQNKSRFRSPHTGYDWTAVGLRWSPDGKWLAANEYLLDPATGEVKQKLNGAQVAWSPTGKFLVSRESVPEQNWMEPRPAKVWDVAAGKPAHSLDVAGAVLGVTDDGRTLVVRGLASVALWDAPTGKAVKVVAKQAAAWTDVNRMPLCWSEDGKRLWYGGNVTNESCAINGVDIAAGRAEQGLAGPYSDALGVWPGRGGVLFARGMPNGSICVSDAKGGSRCTPVPPPVAARLSPDGGTLLVVSSGAGKLVGTLWNTRDGSERVLFNDLTPGPVSWWPDGRVVAPRNEEGRLVLRGWKPDGTRADGPAIGGRWGDLRLVLPSPDGNRVLVAGEAHMGVCTPGKPDPDWSRPIDVSLGENAWSPDGKLVLGIDDRGSEVVVLSAADGKRVREVYEHNITPRQAAFTRDGKFVVVLNAQGPSDARVRFLRAADGKIVRRFASASDVRSNGRVVPAPEGDEVAVYNPGEGTIRLYGPAADEPRLIHAFPPGSQLAPTVEWPADGNRLLFARGAVAALVDPKAGRAAVTLLVTGPGKFTAVRADGQVRGEADAVRFVAFTKDGQQTLTVEAFAERPQGK